MIPEYLTLLLLTVLHEDIAILTAGFFIVERNMPLLSALAVIYTGTVVSNGLLYGLGNAARDLPRLRRWLIGARVDSVRKRLKQHLALTLAVSRFLPGLVTTSALACGWLRIPFIRFAVTTALVLALYLPLMLGLVVALGSTVLQRLSEGSWLIVLVLVLVTIFVTARQPAWAMLTRVAARFAGARSK